MNDTDRITRPFMSVDLTPTTAPSWVPRSVPPPIPTLPPLKVPGKAGGKRLARGTVPPPIPTKPPVPPVPRPASVIVQTTPELPPLPIRTMPMTRRWGQVIKVSLEAPAPRRALVLAPAPATATSPIMVAIFAVLATLIVAFGGALLLSRHAAPDASSARSAKPAITAPAPAPAPAPAVQITPLPEPVITPL